MKFCSHCGAEILDEAVICPKCGCPVSSYVSSKAAYEDKTGTTAMVFGIVSLSLSVFALFILGFLEFIALGLSIPGIILGSKSKISGKGKAGFITSIIAVCISAIGVLFYILGLLAIVTIFA